MSNKKISPAKPPKTKQEDESWGDLQRSCDRLVDEMLKKESKLKSGSKTTSDSKDSSDENYDEDDFDENSYGQEEGFEEDDKLVDEEITMHTNTGKKDMQILKEIIEKT